MPFRWWGSRLAMLAMLVGFPMAGILFAGKPMANYLEFPPRTLYVQHAPFSLPVFLIMAAGILAWIIPFLVRAFRTPNPNRVPAPRAAKPFPVWGWAGLGLSLTAWLLAWTRVSLFAPLQPFTFTPIWLGYIITINALTYSRTGRCMLINRPRHTLGLFILSAVFWWYFEYLNRFVQNWTYHGIGDLSPFQYFIYATLPFSTVLPAVLGTYELLRTGTRHGAALNPFIAIPLNHPKRAAWITVVACGAGLFFIGWFPDYLFPLLWMSPLLLLTSCQCLIGESTILQPLRKGHWRDIYLLALASLICGFFWELWNVFSLAKWVYHIPFVQYAHLFEMPILGYAGYLPFGLECAVIVHCLSGKGLNAFGDDDAAV